jgi:hypothetical protein
MNDKELTALKLALELMHNRGDVGVDEWIAAEAAIKQVIAAPVQERNFCERCGKRLGSGIHTCTPPAQPATEEFSATQPAPVQEPVAHPVIAGALFDFMGWLTSRKKTLILSSADNASPAVEAITEFAKMRGLSLDGARVQDWQDTTPPAQPAPVQEPEYWNVIDPAGNIVASETDAIRGWARIAGSYKPTVEGLLGFHDQGWRVLPKATPPAPQPVPVKTYHDGKPWPVAPKPWVGLTDEERNECTQSPFTADQHRAIEAKLKEKNT